ncbi:MAG TPA: NAD-dependent epimerase/dehydratase family protein [Casimicrobiaceae bacterium]|jgi:nucleoside-diphosphate-sugar epimerase
MTGRPASARAMRVVVSGAAGRLARVLLPRLCSDPAIECVVAIDRARIGFGHPKLVPVIGDIGDAATHGRLDEADALVNLAAVLLRGHTRVAAMRATNVDATKALLAAARERRVAAIVHLSSAAVYGNGEDLAESAPLAPLPGFRYAEQKAEVEAWIARELPSAVVLRPVAILGPNAQPLLRRLFAAPCYLRLPDPQPRFQCIHEDDVAHAVVLALRRAHTRVSGAPGGSGVSGAFNLAAPSAFALRDLALARHPRALSIAPGAARAMFALAWTLARWGGESGWHRGIERSLTLDCARAERALGWRARHADWRTITGVAGIDRSMPAE